MSIVVHDTINNNKSIYVTRAAYSTYAATWCSTYANITDLVIFRHIEAVNEDLVMWSRA